VPSRLQLLALAALIGLATPWLRAWVPGPLPEPIAGYLGQWPAPDGKPVLALFPLFPWLGFALVGAALGLTWSRARTRDALDYSLILTVTIGACCAYFASEAWPTMFRIVRDHDWLSGLVRLAYKVGLVCVLFGLAIAMSQRFIESVAAPIHALGRTSLLVYWVHLEFAFGAAARPFARKLDLTSWAIGTLLLISAMCLLSFIRLHFARGAVRWKLGRWRGTVPS
jgi:fucose 4-O-acetylase-like acetyltransferase